jgi:hypothetical protein
VDRQGDADVIVTYQAGPTDYVMMKALAGVLRIAPPFTGTMSSGNRTQEIPGAGYAGAAGEAVGSPAANTRAAAGKWQYTGKDVSLVCTDAAATELHVPGFARIQGNTYTTMKVDLRKVFLRIAAQGYTEKVNITSDVTIVFPDGYAVTQPGTTVIESATHVAHPGISHAPPAPPHSCRKPAPPVAGIIPEEAAPVAAVGFGVVATGLGMSSFGAAISAWFGKLAVFLQKALTHVIQGRVAAKETSRRKFHDTGSPVLAGFSKIELIVMTAGALLVGLLFYYAARLPLDPVPLGIYVAMGGGAMVVHELSHKLLNRKSGVSTEVQFWGLGATVMVLTSWLFGSVFAQPTLTVAHSGAGVEQRKRALILLAGPAVSILIAIACLSLIPFGGLFAIAGSVGFSMNLLSGVFKMMPVSPCNGREIYAWNRLVWAALFFPLIVVYLLVNM